jgi:ectoine hydroxylase-related dioxygenase (phytanoyl-CoA dioxygenase family)
MNDRFHYTYLDLKIFSTDSLSEVKNSSIKVILGGLYLVSTIKGFRTFYANHYLIEALELKKMPNFNSIIFYLNLLANNELKLTINNKNNIICSGHIQRPPTYNKKEISIDDYILDETQEFKDRKSVIFDNKEKKSLLRAEKTIRNLINCAISANTKKHQKNSVNKKFNLFKPTSSLFKSINDDGYAVIPNFLKKSALNEMKKALINISKREKENGQAYLYGKEGQNQRIYNLLSKDKSFQDFLNCNFINETLKRVYHRPTLHEKYGLSSMAAHIIPPGGEAIPLHIDSVVPDPIPPWMMRFIVIITLNEFTLTNGSTAVIPKSHKLCKRPSSDDVKKTRKKELILTAPAGSLILWDGLIWHRSTDNNSKLPRRSVIVSYGSSFFKEICGEEEHLLVVPKKIMKNSSPQIQSLIGFGRGIKKGAKYIP